MRCACGRQAPPATAERLPAALAACVLSALLAMRARHSTLAAMATVLICLRGNVSLPGDRALSDRELRALLPGQTVARRQLGEAWLDFVGQAATVGLAAAGAPEDGRLA